MQDDRKTLEDALIDVEVSNARAIALGRRFFALQQEAEQLRGEILNIKKKLIEDPDSPSRLDEIVHEAQLPSREIHPKPELKFYLDSVNGVNFSEDMEWSLKSGTLLSLSGWAFLSVSDPTIISIAVKVSAGEFEVKGLANRTLREDVAANFSRPDIAFSGFTAEINLFGVHGASAQLQIEATDNLNNVYSAVLGRINLKS